ncbi:MAG: class I SAM-dependent rRNA methyltransferase [Gammaproteobacteria bacterium]|nr:class I SAM-dependent rRNA methyltransferase [Gammaproteobacteria bacterium]
MTTDRLPPLVLKKNEQRRLQAGHLWVYSNEVDTRKTPLTGLQPGELVIVQAASGKSLGTAYVNPHSLICARLFSRRANARLDAALLERRLRAALELRTQLFAEPYYRLVFGESDGLPGLVVDRYGDVLVVQITTAGMERVSVEIIDVLQQVIGPAGILLRNDSPVRVLEGLPQNTEVIGTVPDSVLLEEGGVRFHVPLGRGQKTGWFFDQRSNRLALHKYVRDKQVLDVFSYVGAWGLQAAQAGATQVTCVDASQPALDVLEQTARDNDLQSALTVRAGDAFDVMQVLRSERRQFDVVIVDPPAFIKRRKDIRKGEQGYARLNNLALELLAPGGILVSCSCSMHLAESRLQHILLQAAVRQGRQLQILERGFQCMDHPVHPAIAETAYLKALFCRVPA